MNAFLKAQKVIFGVVALIALLYGIIFSVGFTVEFIADYFQLSAKVQEGLLFSILGWMLLSFIMTMVFNDREKD
jgi:TRAP-type mannitol/chloroaromatic compound transport system permease small subunit